MTEPKKTETDETAKNEANTEAKPATPEGELSDKDLEGAAGGISAAVNCIGCPPPGA